MLSTFCQVVNLGIVLSAYKFFRQMADALYARDVYGKTLVELGKLDSNIVVMDADLSGSTRTSLFGREFPERFFNMGVAEQNMMSTAAGLASCGKIVFVSTFSMFASARALDQVRNSICYNNFNIKIVASHGGITVGEDGSSHQALEDISFMRSIPEMKVVVPCDAYETKDAVTSAYKEKGPFYIRLGRAKIPVLEGRKKFEVGKGYILEEGKDIAIIACGLMVHNAKKALDLLRKDKITPILANIHTVKPIDEELILNIAKRVKGIVVCEEHSIIGGLGSAVCEVLSENCPVLVKRVGTRDRFGQSGIPSELIKAYNLDSEDIANAAKELYGKFR